MTCPHCQNEIPDSAIARHIASKGGSKSRRAITPKQQRKMQAARKKAKEQEAQDKL